MDQIEKLYIKKWKGSASKEELLELESLLKDLSEEETWAYQKLEIFWKSEGQETPEVSQTQLWNRLEKFIDQDESSLSNTQKKKGIVIPFTNYKIFTVAASILFLLIAGYFLWYQKDLYEQENIAQVEQIEILEKSNQAGQKSTLKLPDGSVVILNSNSKLFVPEKFTGGAREVTLEGEAYFDIVPNPDMPFLVKTKNAKVKVLGTAFNLKSIASHTKIVLNVVEGKVQFSDAVKESNIYVTAHEAAILDTSTGKIESIDFDSDAIAWSKGELVFRSASFQEIVSTLEDWYGVEIATKKRISIKNGFTGRYKNASLKEVLTGISFSVDFDFEIDGKLVVIK